MKRKKTEPLAPEWSYAIEADDVGSSPIHLHIEANEEERSALARRLGLEGIGGLSADMTLMRAQGNMVVHICGQLHADVTQLCVVSLEPVGTHVEEAFEGWFADPEAAISFAKVKQEKQGHKTHGETPILEEAEDPEPIVGGVIDLGELVTQYLALCLPPYPHREGVNYEVGDDTPVPEIPAEVKNPFAALKKWKIGQGTGEE